jgi:hypothetical protein
MNTNQNQRRRKPMNFGMMVVNTLIAISLAAFVVLAFQAITHQSDPTCVAKTLRAVEGDTLWSMVEGNCPDHSRTGETVSIVIRMNHGSDVRPGQIVWFPASPWADCVEYTEVPLNSGTSACTYTK